MKIGRAIILGIIIFFALVLIGKNIKQEPEVENQIETIIEEQKELKGVWVSTAYCLDFPSKQNLNETMLKEEIDTIVNNTKNWGLNAIFFQVRPCSDSFYKSEIYPVSSFLSTKNELVNGFDPLSYFIEKCHENNIELHAWINPLRVTTGSKEKPTWDVESLPENHPARLNPEYTVAYADGKLYYNVGLPQVRELICNGVKEIIENYNVDGIHFDDYFYPYPVEGAEFNDSESYELYGNGLSLEDYRRNSVNQMIELVSECIKSYNKDLSFGVSPQGIWANKNTSEKGSDTGPSIQSYTDLYADSLYWVENKLVDYICPQIYWSFETDGVNFDKVYNWWETVCKENNVKLYAGLSAYKVGEDEYGWDKEGELKNQIAYIRQFETHKGFILFRYEFLYNNKLNLLSSW